MQHDEILTSVGRHAASLIGDSVDPEHAIKVASALAFAAETIYRSVGGPEMAAQQFYAVADKIAEETKPPRELYRGLMISPGMPRGRPGRANLRRRLEDSRREVHSPFFPTLVALIAGAVVMWFAWGMTP